MIMVMDGLQPGRQGLGGGQELVRTERKQGGRTLAVGGDVHALYQRINTD